VPDTASDLRRRLAVAIPALALALLTLGGATEKVADVDVGWVVAAGRVILAEGAAPVRNGLSFTAPDHPWIMHEWLLGPVYALGFRALGAAFFGLVGVASSAAIGWLVLSRTFRVLRSPLVASVWSTLLFVFSFDRLRSARPIGISLVLACFFVVLAFRPRLGPRAIAACVGLELLWTNVHGSFPLGLVVLALAAVDSEDKRGHLFALGGAAAATLLNPYGPRLFGLVASYASGTGEATSLVQRRVLEFSPIWRAGYHDVVDPIEIVIVVGIAVLAVFVLRGRTGRGAAALALLLCTAALLQARNVALAALPGGLALLPDAARLFEQRGGAPREREGRTRPVLLVAPAVALAIVGLVWTARTRPADEWFDPSMGGASFARLARRLPDGARVFVPFRSGGLLLLLAAERGVTTFYDSRNDCYPSSIAGAALALKDGELPPEGLSTLLERHGTTHAIVPAEQYVRAAELDPRWAALAVIEPALRPTWRTVATDGGWVLLEAPPERRGPS
jgi:hypothetical protein